MTAVPAQSEKEYVENRAIARFIDHLKSRHGLVYAQSGRNVLINAAGTNYDFRLTPEEASLPRLAVEVFQLFETPGAAEHERRQAKYWNALRAALEAAHVGSVLVSFPAETSPIQRDADRLAKEHAQLIKAEVSKAPADFDELQVGAFRVVRFPELHRPALSTLPSASWGNGLTRGESDFARNLAKKNTQLAVHGHERVVLIANQALLVDAGDVIRELATMDTSLLTNVDRIYFDCPNRGHTLVYQRAIRDAFVLRQLAPDIDGALLNAWLSAKLDAKCDDAVLLVRAHSERLGSAGWLPRDTRALLLRRIGELVDAGDIELGLWAAAWAVDDIDPPLENYPDDPQGKWNGHASVLAHKDHDVVAVRAQACWLLQKLVIQRAGTQADVLMGRIEILARDENAYVRKYAVVPLTELVNRRRCTDSDGGRLFSAEVSNRARALTLEMLRANAHLPRILDWLTGALANLRDLTNMEATEVLDTLSVELDHDGLTNAARLLVQCAEYSKYSDGTEHFDPAPFRSRLVQALSGGPSKLRSVIAWQMAQQFKADFEASRRLFPYLEPLVSNAEFDGGVFHHFIEIAKRILEVDGASENVEAALLAAARTAVKHRDPTEVFLAADSLTPVIDRLTALGRWSTVFKLLEDVLASPGGVPTDITNLVEQLATAPVEYAGTTAKLVARLMRH